MKQSVNQLDFRAAFNQMDRGDNFTPDALDALFEYLEEFEQDTGAEIELDVIALCCDYTESESLGEWARCYFCDDQLAELLEGSDDKEETLRDYILDHGQLIEFDGGVIVSQF